MAPTITIADIAFVTDIKGVCRAGVTLAAALTETLLGQVMGVAAVALASVNVVGGFLVTRRMLEMFKKKPKKAVEGASK